MDARTSFPQFYLKSSSFSRNIIVRSADAFSAAFTSFFMYILPTRSSDSALATVSSRPWESAVNALDVVGFQVAVLIEYRQGLRVVLELW